MSLINDALKRAKQAQQQAPPTPGSTLQFRPVEPSQRVKIRYGRVALLLVAVLGVPALLLIWLWPHKSAATKAGSTTRPAVVAAKEISAPEPAAATAAGQPPRAQQPASPTASVAAPSPAPTNVPAALTEANPAANPATIAEPPAPKPAPLRLQAIVYNPTRPSAMIGGKTLFVGDKFGALRVVAIDAESATLVGLGQTNVLILDQ